MYTNERLNRLLRHHGLQEHNFATGRGSHTTLDHLDGVAKIRTRGGNQLRTPCCGGDPRYFSFNPVGKRLSMHEAHTFGKFTFWLGAEEPLAKFAN
jgi:hypothetical protein